MKLIYIIPFLLFLLPEYGVHRDLVIASALVLIPLLKPSLVTQVVSNRFFLLVSLFVFGSYLLVESQQDRELVNYLQFQVGLSLGVLLHYLYLYLLQNYDFSLGYRTRWALVFFALLGSVYFWDLERAYELVTPFTCIVSAYLLLCPFRFQSKIAIAVILFPLVLSLNSKGVLLAFLVACLLAFILVQQGSGRRFRVSLLRASLLILPIVSVGLLSLYLFNQERFRDIFEYSYSSSSVVRLQLLKGSAQAVWEHPFFGLGPSGFDDPDIYRRYYSDESISDLISMGTATTHEGISEGGWASGTHNMQADLVTKYGVFVFLFFCIGWYEGFRRCVADRLFLKLAVGVAMFVHGLTWQFTATSWGAALVTFGAWPTVRISRMRND